MYNIIPLALILGGLFIIATIVIRKFSALATLDINTIQAEKEAKFKERIIGNRLKRNISRYSSKISIVLVPLSVKIKKSLSLVMKKLLDFKENYNKSDEAPVGDNTIDEMLSVAEDFLNKGEKVKAEEKFINIISLDSQNNRAFYGLSQLYKANKQFKKAEQTLEHVARLLEKNEENNVNADSQGKSFGEDDSQSVSLSEVYFDLAELHFQQENAVRALQSINKALGEEKNNPRFLDMKLEISIINKDKSSAWDALKKMKEINPDNKKLPEFEIRVKEL